MFNKYGNILTFILIVIIVFIVGILGYMGYDTYVEQKTEKQAQQAIEDFEKATEQVKKPVVVGPGNTSKNEVSNTIDPLATVVNTTVDPMQTVVPENPTEPEPQPEAPKKQYLGDYEILGTINIPKTGAKYPVLAEVTKTSLEKAVGVLYPPNITKLNEPGNVVIVGHNYRNGKFFSNNEKLAKGDTIEIKDTTGTTVVYVIYNIYETSQSDADYMKRPLEEGAREISLSTCTDDSLGRLVIWAKEQK